MSAQHTPGERAPARGPRIVERKVKANGTVHEFECTLLHLEPALAVVRFQVGPGGGSPAMAVRVPALAVSDGWFWQNRPYSLYRIRRPGGEVVAHRFDAVGLVRFLPGLIEYHDLDLDWWVIPGRGIVEEDRDELEADLAAGILTAAEAETANRAARAVLGRYRHIIEEVARTEARLGLPPP